MEVGQQPVHRLEAVSGEEEQVHRSPPPHEGEVEHRDFVLSNEKRKSQLTLCCSRAAKAGGEIVLDL